MSALAYLRARGLTAETLPDGKLSISPVANITTDIRSWVRLHKAELLAELAAQPSVDRHGPIAPCPTCGCCSFYQAPGATTWRCRECKPAVMAAGYVIVVVTA